MLAANLPDLSNTVVADIGCGNGIQGIVAALQGAREVHCCDIDEKELATTRINFETNHLDQLLHTHKIDIFQGLDNLPAIDVAIFNLPAVPGIFSSNADSTERGAVSEGDGSSHTLAALNALSEKLTCGGRIYFTTVSTSNTSAIEQLLNKHFKWNVVCSIWMPWRYFEVARKKLIDSLVLSHTTYYRIEHGVLFEEVRIINATKY